MPAEKQPVTADEILRALYKTGGTVYTVENVEITIPENIFIPVSALNQARRSLLDKITKMRLIHIRTFREVSLPPENTGSVPFFGMRGFFLCPEQIPKEAEMLEKIWIPLESLKTREGQKAADLWRGKLGVCLPRIYGDFEKPEICSLLQRAQELQVRDCLLYTSTLPLYFALGYEFFRFLEGGRDRLFEYLLEHMQ